MKNANTNQHALEHSQYPNSLSKADIRLRLGTLKRKKAQEPDIVEELLGGLPESELKNNGATDIVKLGIKFIEDKNQKDTLEDCVDAIYEERLELFQRLGTLRSRLSRLNKILPGRYQLKSLDELNKAAKPFGVEFFIDQSGSKFSASIIDSAHSGTPEKRPIYTVEYFSVDLWTEHAQSEHDWDTVPMALGVIQDWVEKEAERYNYRNRIEEIEGLRNRRKISTLLNS